MTKFCQVSRGCATEKLVRVLNVRTHGSRFWPGRLAVIANGPSHSYREGFYGETNLSEVEREEEIDSLGRR